MKPKRERPTSYYELRGLDGKVLATNLSDSELQAELQAAVPSKYIVRTYHDRAVDIVVERKTTINWIPVPVVTKDE
jgi:hypothetical protein